MALHLKDLLSTILPKADSWKILLLQKWETIVGELNVQVRLEKIQDDTLTLSVSNASWMHEMHCLSDILIKKINYHLEGSYVKNLRFRCITRVKKTKTIKSFSPTVIFQDIPLTFQQKRALERIDDEHLQHVLKKFLARCHYTNHYM